MWQPHFYPLVLLLNYSCKINDDDCVTRSEAATLTASVFIAVLLFKMNFHLWVTVRWYFTALAVH